jgi:hypothetical protein
MADGRGEEMRHLLGCIPTMVVNGQRLARHSCEKQVNLDRGVLYTSKASIFGAV